MAALNTIANTLPIKVLVIGMSGTGKTQLVGELSSEFNLIWLDLENGGETLLKLPEESQARINYIRIRDSASYPVAAETILQLLKYGKGSICLAHSKYNCAACKKEGEPVEELDLVGANSNTILVLDSLTQLGNSILAHVCKDQPVTYKPERDDWGSLRKYSEYIAGQLQGASYNIVCITHVTEAELEDGRKKLVPVFGSAPMSATMAKYFSHVVYCDVKNNKHVVGSSSTYSNAVVTKSRLDYKLEKMAVPSLLPIFRREKIVEQEAKTEVGSSGSNLKQSPAQLAADKLKSLSKK